MTPESFAPILHRDKVFMEELYVSQSIPNTKRLLNFASDQKLDTIIKVLHFIAIGEIKIKKEHFDNIPNAKIKLMTSRFAQKTKVKNLLKSNRLEKQNVLKKLCPFFSELFYPLFNES